MKRNLGRKTVVGVVGGATVATGTALLVLPGPGLVVIAGGLAILSREFPAAGRLMDGARDAALRRIRRSSDH
jgi:hypothetical protein